MVFTGTYEHAIDAKHRLAIPSDIRRDLQRAMGTGEGDAVLADELRASDIDPAELLDYEEVFYANSKRIEMDSAGRVRLPDHLLKQTGLSGEVVLAGAGDHLKIRDRAAWTARLDHVLKDRPSLLVNPRMMLGRKPKEPT